MREKREDKREKKEKIREKENERERKRMKEKEREWKRKKKKERKWIFQYVYLEAICTGVFHWIIYDLKCTFMLWREFVIFLL